MKAAVHTSYGPPDVVRIAEVEKPATKDNQVLVKVHATTVNRTDCGMRAARPFFIRLFAGLTRPRLTGPIRWTRSSRPTGTSRRVRSSAAW